MLVVCVLAGGGLVGSFKPGGWEYFWTNKKGPGKIPALLMLPFCYHNKPKQPITRRKAK